MNNKKILQCPSCNTQINIDDVLHDQIQKDFEQKVNKKRREYQDAFDKLKSKEQGIEQSIKDATALELKKELKLQETNIKKKIYDEQSESMSLLKEELEQKSKQVVELNKTKALVQTLKRQNDEIESKIQAKSEIEFSQKLKNAKDKIQEQENNISELKLKEKDEQLHQLHTQLKQAQQKAQQGSMQIQGEAQELAIEEYLRQKHPLDGIEEIKKGARGADCLQIVNTKEFQNCGSIYYESKRTKEFQKQWIEKLKDDLIEKGADIGVLVTQTLPKDMSRLGMVNNIWVCTFEEFKGLSYVLRDSIIKINQSKEQMNNKSDKMSLLYSYLTSTEFSMQLESIAEGFIQMQIDLDSEKRAMNAIWKKREKQIDKVLSNTTRMHGSIKGIAGNAVSDIKALSLSAG